MTEARATLKNSQGNTYDMPPNSGEKIPKGFNIAYVHQGTWIFYDSSYNSSYSKHVMVVREGSGDITLGFDASSAREVDHLSDGITLFEHFNYCGVMKVRITNYMTFRSFAEDYIMLLITSWLNKLN